MFGRMCSGGAIAVALGLALVAPVAAQADPLRPGNEPFQLTCGADTDDIVVAGRGVFLPAHDLGADLTVEVIGPVEGFSTPARG
jgi:hypothetical protein